MRERRILMRKLLSLFVLVLLLVTFNSAAGQGFNEELTIYAGSVVFEDPDYDSVAIVEFPFSLARHEFEFFKPTEADSFLYARIFAQVDLINTRGSVVDSVNTYFSVRAVDQRQANQEGIRLFNKLSLPVEPGIYSARLTVIDAVSKRRGAVFLDRIIVEPADTVDISIGGPLLAYRATPISDTAGVNMRLAKSGFLVIPNPVSVFHTKDTLVYVYGEVYNLKPSATDPREFRLSYNILNSAGTLLRSLGSKTATQEGETMAFAESFDIKGWVPGAYDLQIVAEDLAEGDVDTSVTRLAILEPGAVQEVALARTNADDPYSELSLEQKIQLVTYLLTPQQKETMEKLSLTGKANFLAQFWAEHDSNPVTDANEGRNELIRRYRYANQNFSLNEANDDGWSTSRGRVLMTYGFPDEIDERPEPVGGEPYEVWYYRTLDEGKVFVFVDEYRNNDYRLAHSTVYGEPYDQGWEDRLRRGDIDFGEDL